MAAIEIMLRQAPTDADKKRKRIELDKLYIAMAQQARAFEISIETGIYHKRHRSKIKIKNK